MKRRNFYKSLALCLVLVITLSAATATAQGSTPPTVSYQGRVTVNGQPFDGVGYFMFAIVDSQGLLTWTSDIIMQAQSQPHPSSPTHPISLPVSNGLFNVLLGDPTIMNPLTPQAFTDPASYLRVWFSGDGVTFTQLPDRALAAVPYAMVADTLGGYTSNDFALAGHDHWGQSWSGSGAGLTLSSSDDIGLSATAPNRGAMGESTGSGGVGVYGLASAASGTTTGVVGRSLSPDGTGVYGYASATANGNAWGVFGQSDSPTGRGVYGWTTSSTGVNFGVLGQSGSEAGYAIFGDAYSASGRNYGVYGKSRSGEGVGVYGTAPVTGTVGIATNSSGSAWGVYGKSSSPSGYGVKGESSFIGVSGTGSTGVRGWSSDGGGYGVYGRNNAESGEAVGVYGRTDSTSGKALYGLATAGGYGLYTDGKAAIGGDMAVTGLITVQSSGDDGVRIGSAANDGLEVSSATHDGVYVYDAGNASDHQTSVNIYPYVNFSNGVEIAGAAGHGVFIGYADHSGIEIGNVLAHGLEVWNAGGSGVQIIQASVHGGYFNGQQDGVVGETTSSDQEWGVYTVDKMYAGAGYTSGGGMMLVAKSGDAGNLQTGDVVAVAGMASAPGESQNPIPLVRRADKKSMNAAIGVVYRRFVFEKYEETFEHEGNEEHRTAIRANSADGPVAPGDYLLIVVLGPAQVKADASAAAIHAGDLVTAADEGLATKATPLQVNGVEFYAPNMVIGKAMEPLKQGRGLIYIFVTLR